MRLSIVILLALGGSAIASPRDPLVLVGGKVTPLAAGDTLAMPAGDALTSGGVVVSLSTACNVDQIEKWNGTAWACATAGTGTGTVTSIIAGTGLSGGTITTTGTISMPNVGPGVTSYTYSSFTLDAQGRVTAASSGATPALAATTITAGTMLSGGGDLSANRTINLADIATSTVIGRVAAGTGAPSALTTTQLTTLVNPFSSTLSGAVPASGGGTTTYLRADGSFATPPGTGVTSVATGTGLTGGTITTTGTLSLSINGGVTQTATAGQAWTSMTAAGILSSSVFVNAAGTGLVLTGSSLSVGLNGNAAQACGAGNAVTGLSAAGIETCTTLATLGAASGTGTAGRLTEWSNTSGGLRDTTFPIDDTASALTIGNATSDVTTLNGELSVTNPPTSGWAIKSTFVASSGTTAPELVQGFHTGTYNTTAGNLQIYAGDFESTSTRSSGANSLINTAMYLDAHGGQTNYAIYSPAGDALFSGVLSTSSTLSVTGLSTLTGGFTAGAASTVNSTLTVSASTDTQITVSPGGGTRAATNTLLNASTAASFNTTSGAMTSYGVLGQVTSTRSAGANTLTNIALYGNASGAQTNYGLYVAAGNSLLSGTLDMSSNKILNCANGTVSSDGACFGQLATAVNAAVSGTSGTSTRFTGTNVVGNGSFLDSGTYVDRAAANGAFFTLNASGTDFGVIANDGGWIEVAGSATAGGSLVNKAMKWNPNTAATDALGTFESTGAATLDSTLGVTGLSTLTGGFSSGAASSVTGALTLTNTVQASERIRFAGQEYLAAAHTDTNGPALLLMVNRASDRRIALVDSSAEALNNSNPQLQFGIDASAAYIDSGSTDATTARTLNINTRITSPLVIGGAVTMNSTASVGGALNMNSHLINNVTDPASAQDVVTLNFLNNNPGSVSGAYLGRQTFSSTGAYTYTPTTGTHKVRVRVCGAGGGGGGVTGSASNAAAGEGGTAGEYQDFFVDGGTSTLITGGAGSVGTGGSAGANTGGAGGTGGDTTLTIQTVLRTSKGGTGGAGMTTGTSIATAQTASDMGTSSTFGSFMTFAYGTPGIRLSGTVAVAGNGGSSPFGRGGHGHASQGGGESGATGGAHCGGGGGGMSTAAAQTGGAGGDGLVIIDEWRLRMLLSGASPANDNTSRFQLPRFTRAPATGLADIRAAM